jgi:CRISPR/Cas system CSM-associated protein Csm5 (group 7 of RAMP superfamily)
MPFGEVANHCFYPLNCNQMDTINEKYNVKITVLSPLNIGAGAEKDWIKGVDFVVKGNILYHLSLNKMIQQGVDMEKLSSYFANKDDKSILGFIGNKLDEVKDACFTFPIDSSNDVKTCIKNELNNKPIIPGSSLKGAIRSIIYQYLLGKDHDNRPSEKDYFGRSTKGDELMRFIKFSDAEFERTELINTKIFNLRNDKNNWLGGWKHEFRGKTSNKFEPIGFNTIYETIPAKAISIANIMLSKCTFDKIDHANKAMKEKLFDIKFLFQIINNHTRAYIDKEIQFFETYATDKTGEIIDFLNQIKTEISSENSSCVLKMSAGSGFHSITGDWQYSDYVNTGLNNGKKKYKSRKIAVHGDVFSMMGFVKLSTVSDEEFVLIRKEKQERLQKIELDMQLEQERVAEERRKIVENKYGELISRAKRHFENEAYDDSRALLKKAEELLPEGDKHRDLLDKINNIIEEQRRKQEEERERLSNMSPDEREKEKFVKATKEQLGELINASLLNRDLTNSFFQWLKDFLKQRGLWKTEGKPEKDKTVKRCLSIEKKISNN